MKLIINKPQRFAKMRAHTATHILHAELTKLFPSTQQAWSLVDEDYLRFDFKTERGLTNDEISQIEKNINNLVYQAQDVSTQEMSFDEAKKHWAKAFFEDKYGDIVRVVTIKNELQNWEKISIELCWGTHVQNTKDIWIFKITWQEAVASGIKRITALTWPKVQEYIQRQEDMINSRSQKLQVTPKQFSDKLDKTLKNFSELENKFNSLQEKIIYQTLKTLDQDSHSTWAFDKIFKITKKSELSDINFKTIIQQTKNFVKTTLLIYNEQWNFAILSTKWHSAKQIAQNLWLKWWGNDELVQWRDTKILDF